MVVWSWALDILSLSADIVDEIWVFLCPVQIESLVLGKL